MTTFTTEDREIVEKEFLRLLSNGQPNLFGVEHQFMRKPVAHQNMDKSLGINTPHLLKGSN